MKTSLNYLFNIETPWIYVGTGEADRKLWIPSHFYSSQGLSVCVRLLRGRKMRTIQGLMDEISASFQFFAGFGENWHALEECLEYLDEWLPSDAYVLLIENAENILIDESDDQLGAFLKTMQCVGDWWSRPIDGNDRFNRQSIPFHVLLHVSEGDPSAASRILQVAEKENIAIRR